jgi:SAM-dependent methyltransferase
MTSEMDSIVQATVGWQQATKETFYELLSQPVSRRQIIQEYCSGKDVLDLGCVNHAIENVAACGWLHMEVRKVAQSVLGLDYLAAEVSQLRDLGFDVLCADITKPLKLDRTFDVIVVGNLIEHLSGFEGLWGNLERLLRPDGVVLISTPNPFYAEQYYYTAFRNQILINPEHTCWIDPVALDQLAQRFGFASRRVYWIQERWRLKTAICHNTGKRYFDMFRGTWDLSGHVPSGFERVVSRLERLALARLRPKQHAGAVAKYGESYVEALLYLRTQSLLFGAFWNLYKRLIVTSKLNGYEMYMTVLGRAGRRLTASAN